MPRRPVHTYGPPCRLAPLPQARGGDNDDDDNDPLLQHIPPVAAQFFYYSPIPIDDPLSAATISASSSDGKQAKYPIRPFSQGDNHALESAWLGFASPEARTSHALSRLRRGPSPALVDKDATRLAALVERLALQHRELHAQAPLDGTVLDPADASASVTLAPCCPALVADVRRGLETNFCLLAARHWPHLKEARIAHQIMLRMRNPPSLPRDLTSAQHGDSAGVCTSSRHVDLPNANASRTSSVPPSQRPATSDSASAAIPVQMPISVRPPVLDDGISGKPFVRVDDPSPTQSPIAGSLSRKQTLASPRGGSPGDCAQENTLEPREETNLDQSSHVPQEEIRSIDDDSATADIPVGISRLHMVSLPRLQMKPIYWSPVNDIAVVVRATWFYRDTMVPVEPTVANQLEAGYRELRPWTDTWNDELKCAVEVGPLGEEKVSHPLWSTDAERAAKSKHIREPLIASEPLCAARCFRGEAAAEGAIDPARSTSDQVSDRLAEKLYANYHVIYQDQTAAFLLKPSLRPSAYYSRRPVAKITKGMTVGIPVVRGFDRGAWDRIHEKNESRKEALAEELPVALAGDEFEEGHGQMDCPGCRAEKQRAQVTDLILVVHGVGQKLAERVESFHFTHAINAFRRAVNMELSSDAVRAVVRPDQNGIMVLPVNWRHNLSFEDGGPMREEDLVNRPTDGFTLKDIEPGSIPAVRSMISDVMFDIPFYMSHHKPKMIQAMVAEANRVYRLWCWNNPGFSSQGRVHLIGHSLGSAMAIEVLSKQPTSPPPPDFDRPLAPTTHFEFDTKNLFLLGSPAGFFLLLERGRLVPRRGRLKPGADAADTVANNVVGEAGTFGCLAVDNIYNILAKEDPIAYLLNGAVDPLYSSSLRTAYVPAATTGFFQSIGQSMRRGLVPGTSASGGSAGPNVTKPPTVRLPSQLELEVHDFTREEIAERKAYLLNDNGQLDYYLRSGGGPLNVQYLNMLSAHTSYWTNQDLIRLICTEVGRKPGKANTLPSMRAVKAARRIVPAYT